MNRGKELAKNTIIISIGKICTQFVSFLLLPLYTALLTTEEYGVVDLVTTYVQLFLPLLFFQIDQGVFRFLVEKREDDHSIGEMITSSTVFACVQTIVCLFICIIVGIWYRPEYRWYLVANVIVTSFSSIYLQISRGIGDNLSYSIASFLTGLFTIILNIVLIVGLGLKAEGMMLATFGGNAVCIIFLFFRIKLYYYISIRNYSFSAIKNMLRYSIPLVPNALSWWVVNASDRTIVQVILGISANGILAASHKFSSIYTTFYNIFNLSWTESAAMHLKENDGDVFFSDVVDMMFRLFSALCVCMIGFMPFIFPLLINKSFEEAFFQIPIYMYAALFNVVAGLFSVVYISHKKTSEIAKSSIIAGIINILIDLLLIKHIGLFAASVSSAIAYAVMAAYRVFDVKKYINVQYNFKSVISVVLVIIFVSIIYYFGDLKFYIIGAILSVVFSLILNRHTLQRLLSIK